MDQEWYCKYQELEHYIDRLPIGPDEKTIYHFITLWALYNNAYVEHWAEQRKEGDRFIERDAVVWFFGKYASGYLSTRELDLQQGLPENKVKDMRPLKSGKERSEKHLFNSRGRVAGKKFGLFIYQIRCNLFHGDKKVFQGNPDERDMEFIRWALRHLRQLAEYVHNANSTGEPGR